MRTWFVPALCLLLPTLAAAQEIVLVETHFDAPESTVVVRDLASGREQRGASLPHAPGWGAAAAVSPDGRVLGAAALEGGNRPWRNAAVWAVGLDGPAQPRKLLAGAVHAAPVFAGGGLLAVRSVGEHEPSAEEARAGRLLDLDLEVVLLALDGSASRVVYRDRCNALDLVGVLANGEVAVVRSARTGNSLLALRLEGAGEARQVADLGPRIAAWAHLTPDRTAVVFQQVLGVGTWGVVQVGRDGARRELARSPVPFLTPVPVLGGVAFTGADGRSVERLGPAGEITRTLWRSPTAQRLVSAHASPDGRFLAVEQQTEGPARTFVIDLADPHSTPRDAGGGAGRWRTTAGFRGPR